MNREKFAWSLSILLIAILAFQIPGTLAQRDDDYHFVRTLLDIHRQVTINYVDPVDQQKLQQGAIDGMLGKLDPYTVYVPPANQEQFESMLEGSFRGVGIQLEQNARGEVEVVTPIEDSPALRAGVQAGDIITRVNNQEVSNLRLPDVMKKIKGPDNSKVEISVRHPNGAVADLTMTRQEIVVPTVKGYRRGDDNAWNYWASEDPKIGYVRITQFTSDTYKKIKGVLDQLVAQGMRGFILDLRFNPGGQLEQAEEVVNMFVKEGVIVRTKGRNRPEQIFRANGQGTLPDFPMVVLINEHSASAAEIVSGSLMDNHRAITVGNRSFGKGSVQEVMPLGDSEGELKITVAYYYLPSGRLVHRKPDSKDWGVDPQISVPMNTPQEEELLKEQSDLDVLHGPLSKTTTQQTTQPATAAATQPADPQFDAALEEVTKMVANGGKFVKLNIATRPSTEPAISPAQEPQ